ncbi:polysaccharide deacetylase [Leucobacter allii]|uniref:polysaccharide deacetylase family protein n=1 Tax=Leucobacter allii TaxID=2932247 RepID=UPI001FD07163|nr:polysaccharide deacetylase [Leucobacter allii]UOR01977.1 polysaccharide deacetylase [Leucobacter allii]
MTQWPGGHRYGATLSFDFDAEEVWIGENPANAAAPGVLSQGAYGPKVGLPLILRLLARHGIAASFYICGKDALRHPDAVRAIIDAGHEVAHHGHSHTSPTALTAQQERDELEAGLEALRALGAEVVGYRSPSWEFSARTLDLLVEAGFAYSSNLLDDLVPYRHPAHDIMEVPISWILDDAPHFWFANDTWEKTIRSPGEVLDVWLPEIDGIAGLGGHVMVTTHPMLSGRPSRLQMLDTVIGHLQDTGAWIATTREVAAHARANGPLALGLDAWTGPAGGAGPEARG